MREIRDDVARWFETGSDVALAQVTKTWGSSPRVPGSVMAVSDRGGIAGSVSGGCVEGSVIQAALDCLEGRQGASLERFHASTARAQEVGLSCGGNIEVLVGRYDRVLFETECAELDAERSYVRLSLVEGPEGMEGGVCGLLVSPDAAAAAGRVGLRAAEVPGQPAWRLLAPCEAEERLGRAALVRAAQAACAAPEVQDAGLVRTEDGAFFFARTRPQPLLVCVGSVHISIHLTRMAKMLGYRTVVVDPRGAFATEERFPFVDELVHAWPQEAFETLRLNEATAFCALTHDPKIDVPALAAALDSPAFYIGSLGRYTTQLSRYRQLVCEGYDDAALSRVFGPIGLDLKGRAPAEIALSIMAEITAVRYGGAFPLSTMLASARRAEAERAGA
ncbi:XdhC family protein [Eggerthella sinensis]|uniref:XdhC family protein n=1 Tax=Eggerthella sinensis TaxID=242230 RepID=UPI00266D6379|nr:XdhC/CoxI family protein [Eggerthella sinensis]